MAGENIRGNNVLSGVSGTIWLNNEKIMEVVELKADITADREDVLIGRSKDSKIVSLSGTYSLKLEKVYSRAKSIFDEMKLGKDPRVIIAAKIEDTDAIGGQIEKVVLNNCYFNGFSLINIATGSKIDQTFDGGFTPTDAQIEDYIK